MTNNIKFTTAIDRAEADALNSVQLSKSNYLAALERVPLTEEAAEEADMNLAEIESDARSGGSNFTAADHAEAVSRVRLTQLAAEGAEVAVKRTKKALRSSDTTIATLLEPVLTAAVPGATVRASFAKPADAPRPADCPFVLILQTEDAEQTREGMVNGDVEVVYYKTKLHKPLDIREVTRAAELAGIQVEPIGSVVSMASDQEDRLRLRVRGAYPGLPLIPSVLTDRLPRIGQTFAAGLVDAVRFAGTPVKEAEKGFVSTHLAALPYGTVVIDESYNSEGTRTLTIETLVLVRVDQLPDGSRTIGGEINRMRAALESTVFGGLGRVSSVERVDESELFLNTKQAAQTIDGVRARRLPTNAQNIGFESVEQVALRVILKSNRGVADNQVAA